MAKGSVRRLVPDSIPWNLWQLHGFNQQMRGGAAWLPSARLAEHGTAKSDVEIDQALKLSTVEKSISSSVRLEGSR